MNKYPALIRGTNSKEIEFIFGDKGFKNVQKRIHAYVVCEGFEDAGVDLGLPLNPKNTFEYVEREALSWAAWLDRNGRYSDTRVKSEDKTGGYLVYFNKGALDYYVGQDDFDKKEVLSAVKLWLGGLSHFDVDRVIPLLFDGYEILEDRVGEKLGEPLFESRGKMLDALFDCDGMKNCFGF